VNPITGGGLHTALTGGLIAGNFLAELAQSGSQANADNLKEYQVRWLDRLGNKMWQLYNTKKAIFKIEDIAERNHKLYDTMSDYFNPLSIYKKI
jgi:digeranylgeranylglycerophospholipid reductase